MPSCRLSSGGWSAPRVEVGRHTPLPPAAKLSEGDEGFIDHFCAGQTYDAQVAGWEKGKLAALEENITADPTKYSYLIPDLLQALEDYERCGESPWEGKVEELEDSAGTTWVVYVNEHED